MRVYEDCHWLALNIITFVLLGRQCCTFLLVCF